MGDRVSISFANEDEESVCLYSHWSGRKLAKLADTVTRKLHDPKKDGVIPCSPSSAMLYFIMEVAKSKKPFAQVPKRFDNGWEKLPVKDTGLDLNTYKCDSDNGHYTIRLDKNEILHEGGSNVCYDCGADFDDENAECTEECMCYNFDCFANHRRDFPDCRCEKCCDFRSDVN